MSIHLRRQWDSGFGSRVIRVWAHPEKRVLRGTDVAALAAGILPGKHDHLVLSQEERSLIYSDPRMFGRVRLAHGKGVPEWWRNLPPAVISPAFTRRVG